MPWYDVVGRRLSRNAARGRAATEDQRARQRWELEQRNRQEELDAFWRRLTGDDPATVIPFVQQAFEDNKDPAAMAGLEGDEASLAVLVPGEEVVPDRIPGVTPTGRPSIRKMPAKEAAVLHRQAVAGTLLLTAMEAVVAPGLASVKIAALNHGGQVAFVWNARIRREALDRCLAHAPSSLEVLVCAADENDDRLIGGARRLGPLDPAEIGWSELQRELLRERKDMS